MNTMKSLILLCLFLMILIYSNNGFSQTTIENIRSQPYLKDKHKVNCDSAETTAALRICANLQFQESDSILNITYQKILKEIDTGNINISRFNFISSQEKWIGYRDKHCNLYWEMYEGGSLQSIVYLNCLTYFSNERRGELLKFLDWGRSIIFS